MHGTFLRERLRALGVPEAHRDDAVQDVLEVLARRIEAYDERYSVRQWMAGVARNVARRHRRRGRAEPSPLDAVSESASEDDPERDVLRREACELLTRFLDELDGDRWAVFVLSEIEGLRGTEIAAELGVNLSTVYARLRSAHRAFDRALARRRARERRWAWLAIGWGRPATSLAAVSTRVLAGIVAATFIAALLLLRSMAGRDEETNLRAGRTESAERRAPEAARIDGDATSGVPVGLEQSEVAVGGVVRDLTGGTIEDAVISAYVGSHEPTSGGRPSGSASSDPDGGFTLWATPGPVRLVAHADGYATASTLAYAPSDGNAIVMIPGSQIRGRVLWRDTGQPVERAHVSAVQSGGDEAELRSAIAASSGEYEIAGLSAGRYSIVARVEGGVGRSPRSVELGIGETARAPDVLLVRAPSVVLEVHYADGSACTSGSVALRERQRWELVHANIGANGVARFPAVLPGLYAVKIDCAGAVARTDGGDLDVGEDATEVHASYRVERGLTLAGKLETSSGTAVAGRSIVAVLTRGSSRAVAVTDARGAFELDGLQPNGRYAVLVDGAPAHPAEVSLPSQGPVDDIVLRVPDRASLHGTVAFSDGSPAKGIAISATSFTADGVRTLSDASGRYRFDALAPGDYGLLAENDSAVLRATAGAESTIAVTLAPGDALEVDVVVERSEGEILGTIVAADGSPVVDAAVGARRISGGGAATQVDERQLDAASRSFSTLSDADGRFRITDLADGSYTVVAAAPGGGRATAAAVSVGADVVIRLGETGGVRGTAVHPDGDAPDAFVATLARSGHGVFLQELFVGTNGAWEFDDVPLGEYAVAILADDAVGRAVFSVAGERQQVSVELAGGGSVEGRVVSGLDGRGVPDSLVFVESVDGWADALAAPIYGRSVKTSADGSFVYENPPLGVVQVRVTPSSPAGVLGDNAAFVTVAPSEAASVGTIVVFPESTGDGDIGFTWAWPRLEVSPFDFTYIVESVEAAGPVAGALRAGDEIVAINGHDVTRGRFLTLLRLVPPRKGTHLELTTASGRTIEVLAR